MSLQVLSLFSGVGGLELGLSMAGDFSPVAFCEQNLYARAVLAKNWPGVPQYDDVRTLTGHALAADGIGRIDVLTAGFPCQPHSLAGKRGSSEDERDLWGEVARLAAETQPRWLVAENVPGLLSSADPAHGRGAGGFFGRVLRDLAQIGFNAEWHTYGAASVGAHHLRSRVFIVAYPNSSDGKARRPVEVGDREQAEPHSRSGRDALAHTDSAERWAQPEGRDESNGNDGGRTEAAGRFAARRQDALADTSGSGRREQHAPAQPDWAGHAARCSDTPDWAGGDWEQPHPLSARHVVGAVRDVAHGVSARVAQLERLGNAVVPQQAAVIGRAITEAEAHHAQYGVMPDQIVQPQHLAAR